MPSPPKRYRGRRAAAGAQRSKPSVRGRKPVGRGRKYAKKAGMPKRQLIQSNLGGLSMTRFTASARPNGVARTIKRVGQSNFINVTYPGVSKCVAGKQGVSTWYLNAGNDLRRIWASIQGLYVAKNVPTGAEFAETSPPSTVPNASFRYVLESAISMLNIANTCGTPINMELYDCVSKRDSPQLPLDFQGNLPFQNPGSFQGTNILDPGTAWSLGMKNEAAQATGFSDKGVVTVADFNDLGSTPYQSKLFKDYFKVVRKTNVSLPIGGQHKHFVDLKPNFVVDNDLLQQNNAFKGVSFFTIVVISGVPVIACPGTENPLANPIGDVTTSATTVSIIQSVRYKWTWSEDSRENIYRASYINPDATGHQSVQPAMNKVFNANSLDLQLASYDGTSGVYTSLPSDCTR